MLFQLFNANFCPKLHVRNRTGKFLNLELFCNYFALSVCYYRVTYEFQSESTLYSLSECQETPCSKQALSVRLRTKWWWVRILLPSLKLLFLVLQVKKALRYSSFTVNFLQLSRKAFVQNKFIENETNSNQTYPMGMVILFATPIAETNIR